MYLAQVMNSFQHKQDSAAFNFFRVASFQNASTTIFFLKTSLTLWIVEHYYQILLIKNSGWENREVPGMLATIEKEWTFKRLFISLLFILDWVQRT